MVWYTRLVSKLAAAATSSSTLFKKLSTQNRPTPSKLGETSSTVLKNFTTQNHPISTLSKQKYSFSNHLGVYKSPPPPLIISSKYGQYYPNNVLMVKRYSSTYARRDLPEWLRKILVYKYTHIYYLCAVFTLPTATWIICTGRYETIPYTNRTHFVMIPASKDKVIAKNNFNKDELAVLPEEHPDSVRVKSIGDQIVKALESYLAEAMNNKGHKELSVDHLKGMQWEFVVAYDTGSTSFSVPGGKICVSADMLSHLKSDADIATVIGHEVGHIVARHFPAALNMHLLFNCAITMGAAVVLEENPTMGWRDRYTGSPRDEMEADYIGLLLMASAGFDPQEAPKVYAMLDQLPSSTKRNFYRIHPSGKKRAEYLAKAKEMEEAKNIYLKTIESSYI